MKSIFCTWRFRAELIYPLLVVLALLAAGFLMGGGLIYLLPQAWR